MEKSVSKSEKFIPEKCPYPKSKAVDHSKQTVIRIDYDLEYNDEHQVIKVEKGSTDLIKEVNSHQNEVGLVNVIKNAIAHGDNPYQVFRKTEDGVPFAVDPNSTMDEIVEAFNANEKKLDEIAKSLGVSTNELIKSMNDGTVNKLIEASTKKVDESAGE